MSGDRPAVINGSYVDLRFMPGLKCARVFVDIPIEHSNAFLKMFDAPDRANPVPVAIARLVEAPKRLEGNGPVAQGERPISREVVGESPAGSTKREYTRSQVAALKCQDLEFQRWLQYGDNGTRKHKFEHAADALFPEGRADYPSDAEIADYVLKDVLGISSKKELDVPGPKADAWDSLIATYDNRMHIR